MLVCMASRLAAFTYANDNIAQFKFAQRHRRQRYGERASERTSRQVKRTDWVLSFATENRNAKNERQSAPMRVSVCVRCQVCVCVCACMWWAHCEHSLFVEWCRLSRTTGQVLGIQLNVSISLTMNFIIVFVMPANIHVHAVFHFLSMYKLAASVHISIVLHVWLCVRILSKWHKEMIKRRGTEVDKAGPLQRPYFNFTFCTGHHKPFTQQTHTHRAIIIIVWPYSQHFFYAIHSHPFILILPVLLLLLLLLVLLLLLLPLYSWFHFFSLCRWCDFRFSTNLRSHLDLSLPLCVLFCSFHNSHSLAQPLPWSCFFATAITFSSFGLCDACLKFNSPRNLWLMDMCVFRRKIMYVFICAICNETMCVRYKIVCCSM